MVAKYAGRAGDGFICTSGKKPELYTETLLPNVVEGLEAASAPKPDYDRMIEVKVSFDTDKQRALEDTRHWAALALSAEEKMSVEDPVEMERLADACRYTMPGNETGMPGISLPAGLDADGLPIGVQVHGNFAAEDVLIQVAAQIERAKPAWFGATPGVHVSK